MTEYKSSARDRQRAKMRRDAIKAAGGAEYEALLAKEREARAAFRANHPDKLREYRRSREKTRVRSVKSELVRRARARGRKRGLEATVTMTEISWPTHCPVLGIELDYSTPRGSRDASKPNLPTLDRWDNSKGYVAGNVYIISMRANALKSNGTPDELEAVARYARGALPQ